MQFSQTKSDAWLYDINPYEPAQVYEITSGFIISISISDLMNGTNVYFVNWDDLTGDDLYGWRIFYSGGCIIDSDGNTILGGMALVNDSDYSLVVNYNGDNLNLSLLNNGNVVDNYTRSFDSRWDVVMIAGSGAYGESVSVVDAPLLFGIRKDINDAFNDFKSLVNHKLSLIGYDDESLNLTELTNLLGYFKYTNTANFITEPSYGNNLTLRNSGEVLATYDEYLRDVIDDLGLTNTGDWTSMVNQIKVTPTVSLTYSGTPSSGNTITLSATVTYDNSPLSGITVTFKDSSNNTIGTGTTNSSGVVTYSFTYSSPVTVKAVTSTTDNFSSVYSEEITVKSYLFYDTASSNGLSEYGSYVRKEGGATPTIEYDSTLQAYKLSTGDGCNAYYPILDCSPITTDFIFEADVKPTETGSENCVGLAIGKTSTTDRLILIYLDHGTQHNSLAIRQWNTRSEYLTNPNQSLSKDNWYHMKCTLIGTSLNVVITLNDTVLMDTTVTVGSEFNVTNNDIQLGLYTGWSGTVNGYIKNVSVKSA